MNQNPENITNKDKAIEFFKKTQELMTTLWARWQDEKQYEDIKDYQMPLNTIATSCGVTIMKMNKRPFGCDIQVGDQAFQLRINSQNYSLVTR
jgi:hypothetical protein